MNRPKIEDALTRRTYTDELERYCDYLEKNRDKQFNAGFNKATKICSEKIIALEEALDEACYELMRFAECDRCPMKDDHCMITNWQCRDKWKKRLLKDE